MGLKGKIKGSYLYTQWKLGKYTKRRVKHSNIVNYNYEDEEMDQGYPVNSSNSYSGNSQHGRHNTYNQNTSTPEETNNYNYPGTYNRMAYYPADNEDEGRYNNSY